MPLLSEDFIKELHTEQKGKLNDDHHHEDIAVVRLWQPQLAQADLVGPHCIIGQEAEDHHVKGKPFERGCLL